MSLTLYTAELKSKSAAINLAFEDEFLRRKITPQTMYLFFYENFSSLVLGKSLEIENEIYTTKKHPPVYRRISGGGSVLHTVGNLNFSLFLSLSDFPEMFNVSYSYEKILDAVKYFLGKNISRKGYSDLAFFTKGEMRKFSGNAQCRKRGLIMHHGTLLYSKRAVREIPYYLRPPPKEPKYREGRTHKGFMAHTLPCYTRTTLMRYVRLGIAQSFGATLRSLKIEDTTFITPFQTESVSR
ncbi:MAG: Lipoate-protein ligase A [Turneriella sp.]|nr:Lipoate-protein ligase A [Turneriella sp.]